MRHAPPWQLALPGRPAGDVIRALAWPGRQRGTKATPRIARTLDPEALQALASARGRLPTWLAEEVSHVVAARG